MCRGTSPGIALQAIELDGLSGRVALCRSVSATDGSRNGSLRLTGEARSRSGATAGNPAERLPGASIGRSRVRGWRLRGFVRDHGRACRLGAWVSSNLACVGLAVDDKRGLSRVAEQAHAAGRPTGTFDGVRVLRGRTPPVPLGKSSRAVPAIAVGRVRHRRTGRQARPHGATSHCSGRAFRSVRSTG
jgi:hypothetical protein